MAWEAKGKSNVLMWMVAGGGEGEGQKRTNAKKRVEKRRKMVVEKKKA